MSYYIAFTSVFSARWKAVEDNCWHALRLNPSDLDTIETSPHSTTADKCLSEMLILSLKGNYNVEKFGKRMLVGAVMAPAGGADRALLISKFMRIK